MRTTFKRLITLLLCFALLVEIGIATDFSTLFSINASALTPSYTPSSSYRGSSYYTKLCAVSLTGNQRNDIANVALSQEGYYESNSKDKLSGANLGEGTYSNYTEYGNWYGKNGVAWCAIFISWCAAQAGVSTSIINKTPTATAQAFCGTYYNFGSVTPQVGDIIALSTSNEHVGLIYKVDSSFIYTIEGNMRSGGTRVSKVQYSKSTGKRTWNNGKSYDSKGIARIACPKYNSSSSSSSVYSLTINYYSNYADKSFSNPLNAVGANKNVLVKTIKIYSNDYECSDGLHNYTNPNNGCYLARTGYTATGNWNTKADGTGISINQNTGFSSCIALSKALGKDITNSNQTVNLYPEWVQNKLTVNYYSNYADKSFSNPLNAVGANKNVLVKTYTYTVDDYGGEGGLHNYTGTGNSCYLGRTGYTATGNWNTKANGSGTSVNQYTAFSSFADLVQALGKDISSGNTTINLYPEWLDNTLTVNYFSNYADKSFSNPLNAVGATKNVLVKTYTYDVDDYGGEGGLHNYTGTGHSCYLGRTGYTATGNWNTNVNATGISVNQYTAFSSLKVMAQALGKDLSTGNATINLYPEWNENNLVINYYSNYAETSATGVLNPVGPDKNVIIKTQTVYYSTSYSGGLCDYSVPNANAYVTRKGYSVTGNWNTKADGSGYSVNESTGFSTGQAFAKALGKDISNGNATVSVYPEWVQNKLTVNYYSNYADKSFANPLNAVGSGKNVLVKTENYLYANACNNGLSNYSTEGSYIYLGRTGYTTTGYWNTKADGSGKRVHQDTSFATSQALAQALGLDLSNGNATVNLYPEWKTGVDAPGTSINKNRAKIGETFSFSYTPVTGATISHYRIECKKADGTVVISVNNNSGNYQFSINEPGEYSITAIAVTPEGIESNPNNWKSFTVYSEYNVTLNYNCSFIEPVTSSVESDTGLELPYTTIDGLIFVGWNTKADGSGTYYFAGSTFKPLNDTVLYAIWEEEICEHLDTYTTIENAIEATCTSAGSREIVTYCSNCGEEIERITETEEMLGHSFTNYVYNNDATTEKDGTETAKCDLCGETDTRIAEGSKLHSHSYSVSITPPTCTEKGYTTYSCNCGDSYIADYANALGHSFTNYIYNNDATTEADGTETAKCDRCDQTDTRVKPGTKITPDAPTNPTANSKINVASVKTVDYRSKVIIKATASNLDPAYHLVLVINGTEYEGNNKEVSHDCGEVKGDISYFVKIVDASGNIQKDAKGAELKKDGGKITCNAGFFQKIIAFFRGLFGLLPNVEIKP